MDTALLKKHKINKTTMLDAALGYASKGFAVFPLEAQGKKPITRNGLKDATTDIDIITDMWTKYPYANIGMACGKQSGGIIVVDVDVDNDVGKDGFLSLKAWEKAHGELPETAGTVTGRGGSHLLYKSVGDTKSRVACLEGIDIRADGGYIVLPPSIHPNGSQYTWEFSLDDYGVANADKTVLDLMNNGVEPNKKFTMPKAIPQGERNGTLYKLACSMQARGNSDSAILKAVEAENQERCNPPLDDEEVNRIVTSALTKEKGTALIDKPKGRPKKETKPLTPMTLSELRGLDLQPPEFLIDGLLPKGVCLLGAPPKLGKSWMALDMAMQIAKGGWFLKRKCKQAGVLYLALEDSWYRVLQRSEKLLNGEPAPKNFYIDINAEKIDPEERESGLYKQLEDWFDRQPDVEFVIIDTLQLVRPSKQKGDDEYASVYRLLNSIRPFWQDRQIGFLLIHHTRKRSINDVDPFETFLGSQGLTGATDAMYLIQSNKGEDYCNFYGRGRDFEDVMEYIHRNEETCRWEMLGSRQEMEGYLDRQKYETNPIVLTIRKILNESNGLPVDILISELKDRIQADLGVVVGTSARNFSSELNAVKQQLEEHDQIVVTKLGNTTRHGKQGTYYRISQKKVKA